MFFSPSASSLKGRDRLNITSRNIHGKPGRVCCLLIVSIVTGLALFNLQEAMTTGVAANPHARFGEGRALFGPPSLDRNLTVPEILTVPVSSDWIQKVNVTDTSTTLTKTGGCDGCADAGAISQKQLSSGDGYMEFTASSGSYGYIGLGTSTGSTTTHTEINFGISFGSGAWQIREIGWTYKADGSYSNDDVFRIGVESGQVVYRKNGSVIYTSSTSPTYPLVIDTSLMPAGANIYNVIGAF